MPHSTWPCSADSSLPDHCSLAEASEAPGIGRVRAGQPLTAAQRARTGSDANASLIANPSTVTRGAHPGSASF